MSPNSRNRDAIAAEWVARLDLGGLGEGERRQFDAWLASDPKCHAAYVRAQAVWMMAERAKALPGIDAAPPARNPLSRRVLLAGGAAAALAAAAVVVVRGGLPSARFGTALGEISRVGLEDGSTLVIGSESRVDVELSASRRKVDLRDGEAWFEVAKDAARPFVVQAGLVSVRAVGTAFSVRRLGDGVRVLVNEGTVEVAGDGGVPTRHPAGTALFQPASGGPFEISHLSATEMENALAWRDGMLALTGQTLEEAVAEMNRYNQVKLAIAGSRLAGERLVGLYRLTDPRGFAAIVGRSLGTEAADDGAVITLRRRAGN